MGQLVYYLLLKPVSMLPLAVLYRFSDLLYLILYRLAGYRTKVVLQNLRNSFPEKSEEEIKVIASNFYRHLCDLMVEVIRGFSMPAEEFTRRCHMKNPELLNSFHEKNQSILIVAGHYNNWEMAAVSCAITTTMPCLGIYSPLSNVFLNKKMAESRRKYGLQLTPTKETRATFERLKGQPTAIMFGGDQSPSNAHNAYWMEFLNQETGVLFGTEKYARDYNYPVVYGAISKLKRGYYEMEFSVLEENPATAPYGSITEAHTRLLESYIRKEPSYWLWTHRRWKKEKPAQLKQDEMKS